MRTHCGSARSRCSGAKGYLTGFDPQDIDGLLLASHDDENADSVPPLPEVAASRPGDLWICGSHRVLCGYCTHPENINRLLGIHEPLLMVTDPPYGIEL